MERGNEHKKMVKQVGKRLTKDEVGKGRMCGGLELSLLLHLVCRFETILDTK